MWTYYIDDVFILKCILSVSAPTVFLFLFFFIVFFYINFNKCYILLWHLGFLTRTLLFIVVFVMTSSTNVHVFSELTFYDNPLLWFLLPWLGLVFPPIHLSALPCNKLPEEGKTYEDRLVPTRCLLVKINETRKHRNGDRSRIPSYLYATIPKSTIRFWNQVGCYLSHSQWGRLKHITLALNATPPTQMVATINYHWPGRTFHPEILKRSENSCLYLTFNSRLYETWP